MSLGVLNNINAIYAENNLNNTSNSLSTVLQQLSSGSKINSGADDAAGLSLVNGLQANSQALAQSGTNAQEGVGLLSVADGALSQVTNLLNRAVTLATEASNGTLNSSQDTAANQEYQSILSEISNIGSTTTYNNTAVFGTNTNIYTGDSSTTGASIDSLNIRSLSSSNVGDTNGVMAYDTGSSGNNVFVDLSNQTGQAGGVATINDTLNGGAAGTTSMTITTLSSSGTDVSTKVTVGGSSGFENTAAGMISAINGLQLGVTASFTTAAVAGDTSALATDTGIMITGSVGAGSNPSQSSYSGVVAADGNTVSALATEAATGTAGAAAAAATKAGSDIMSGSISLQVGNNASTTVTAAEVATANSEASGAVTMSQLASYITTNAGLGVTATVDATTGALDLTTSNNSTAALKVSSNLTDNTLKTSTAGNETTSYTATSAYNAGVTTGTVANNGIEDSNIGNITAGQASTKVTAGNSGADDTTVDDVETIAANAPLAGALTVVSGTGAGNVTFQLGSAASGSAGSDTLAHLAASITAAGTNLGFSADINSTTGALEINQITTGSGTYTTAITASTAATTITAGASPVNAHTASAANTPVVSILSGASLAGQLTITDGLAANNTVTLNLGTAGTTDTLAHLAATLNTLGTTGGAGGTSLGFTADIAASGNLEIYQTGTTGNGTQSATQIAVSNSDTLTALAQTSGTSFADGGVSSTGGIATISYTDKAGTSLSGTDLSTQNDAESTLTALNAAITAVAAQDGYIGAQINTLNSVSSVLSTQAENVTSAQNAVQATDYASATSNMSKYQILSQTGISALAQANSMQQEVTKLLQ
jgi:flagellin